MPQAATGQQHISHCWLRNESGMGPNGAMAEEIRGFEEVSERFGSSSGQVRPQFREGPGNTMAAKDKGGCGLLLLQGHELDVGPLHACA
jgi:hypothetical protein